MGVAATAIKGLAGFAKKRGFWLGVGALAIGILFPPAGAAMLAAAGAVGGLAATHAVGLGALAIGATLFNSAKKPNGVVRRSFGAFKQSAAAYLKVKLQAAPANATARAQAKAAVNNQKSQARRQAANDPAVLAQRARAASASATRKANSQRARGELRAAFGAVASGGASRVAQVVQKVANVITPKSPKGP